MLGYFSKLKLTGSGQTKVQPVTNKTLFLGIGEFTDFPKDWTAERCGTRIMFLNPTQAGATCQTFFKEAPVAVTVEIKTTNSEVSGKTSTVTPLTGKYYLHLTLNDSKYKAEYDRIVKGTTIGDLGILGAPEPIIVQPTGYAPRSVDTVTPEVQQ